MSRLIIYKFLGLFILPIVALLSISCPKAIKVLIKSDFKKWCEWKNESTTLLAFCALFLCFREFRSVTYNRLGILKYPWAIVFPGQRNLTIACRAIGPGLIVQHGYSTVICAESVGSNFHVNQCVNIVWNGDKRATIGNNVTVCAGAIIVGGVTIGDNVIIGAGTVIVKDIPSNSVAVGNPARILNKN